MVVKIAVDVGGTFTDFSLLDAGENKLVVHKALSQHGQLSDGIIAGMKDLLELADTPVGHVNGIMHATTVTSNAIIERKGLSGLITTRGFRDVLEIGREVRYDCEDPFILVPAPIVPRFLRMEVPERMDAHGNVVTPLDQNAVLAAARELVEQGVRSIGIAFLHSYANNSHERMAAEIIRKQYPDLYVSISSEVARQHGEFERTSTTVLNAYIQPAVKEYMAKLEGGLIDSGFDPSCELRIMTSTGGLVSAGDAGAFPVRCVESGPAAGVLSAQYFGVKAGYRNLLAFDMGGTTAKVSAIIDGEILRVPQIEVSRTHRLKPGSGYPILARSIELLEIGAGGGSLAHIDSMNLLKVGPESAGSDPGPACYDGGGTRPAVTDADLVLGYLNPDYFLGGKMRLSTEAAREAIKLHCADKLSISVVRAAAGIFEVVNEYMVSAIRSHATERGIDVRKYALVASGGAGPVHAYDLVRRLGVKTAICPPQAGVGSSLGLLVCPPMSEASTTFVQPLASADIGALKKMFQNLESEAVEALERMGIAKQDIIVDRSAEVQYIGQDYLIEVNFDGGEITEESVKKLVGDFEARYSEIYGIALSKSPTEVVNWRVSARSNPTVIPNRALRRRNGASQVKNKGQRQVYFPEIGDYITTNIYDRAMLDPNDVIAGPAVLEEQESTIVVGPRGTIRIDENYNAIIEVA